MQYKEAYHTWLNQPYFDQETKEELQSIQDDEKEIEDRFYKDLEFGTGGLRGIIGAGTNRINPYTVRRATQGLADYLLQTEPEAQTKGVAIAYDSRHKSPEFAMEAALVLAANGLKAYLFEALRTTPELSFAVRELNCAAGIVITASHNPPEYNGYKVYGADGGQIVPQDAEKIIQHIQEIRNYQEVKYIDKEKALSLGLLKIIGEQIDTKYIDQVKNLALRPEIIEKTSKDFTILYTPLHGTGMMPVQRVLKEVGFKNLHVVPEQANPDPDFSTVKSPNPEEHEAFTLALQMARKIHPHVILGTDPDCDRVGVVVKNHQGEYEVLTGNQTGALVIDYILSSMEEKGILPQKGILIKTIVTSEMGAEIARSYGVDTFDTLTGFKFIGEKIKEFEESGEKKFVFGYEESYGYLTGTFVRDKDGVIASLLICEMAAYHHSQGKTLYDALTELYEKYGYYQEALESMTLKGKEGMERIHQIMEGLRNHPPSNIAQNHIKLLKDYGVGIQKNLRTGEEGHLTLPKSDVLHFTLEDGSWFCVRPSGTEPKLKIYFSVNGGSKEEAKQKLTTLKHEILDQILSL